MKLKMPALVVSVFAFGLMFAGCKTPSPYLYTPITNSVSESVIPLRTNTVISYITNSANVVVTNVVEKIIYATNTVYEVGYVNSTNVVTLTRTAGAIGNVVTPGSGGLIESGLTALLVLIAGFWRHKVVVKRLSDEADARVSEEEMTTDNVAKALTYTIENYRDVLLKSPNGEALDTKLMNEAQKAQTALNVSALVADIVKTYVRSPDVQEASAKVSEEARRLAGTP
jgi:hypothetical protein